MRSKCFRFIEKVDIRCTNNRVYLISSVHDTVRCTIGAFYYLSQNIKVVVNLMPIIFSFFPVSPLIFRPNETMRFAFIKLLVAALATTITAQQEKNEDRRVEADDSVTPFVIGGTLLDFNVWNQTRRYLVDIKYYDPEEKKLAHACGATLISPRVVLTAAREFLHSFFVRIAHSRIMLGYDTKDLRPSLLPGSTSPSLLSYSLQIASTMGARFPRVIQSTLDGMPRMMTQTLQRSAFARPQGTAVPIKVLPMLSATKTGTPPPIS